MARIFRSDRTEPRHNLSLEESLFRRAHPDTWLYLWQNAPSVVLGRSQNAYLECDVPYLREQGIPVVRRLSGGGAVWHDLGNLNYTFLAPVRELDEGRCMDVIVSAVTSLGIPAVPSGRNDLLAGGKKISGTASYQEGDMAFFHGTILIDADLDRMSRALTPAPVKVSSHSVPSVRSRVANLREWDASLTAETVGRAVTAAFRARFGPAGVETLPAQHLPSRYDDDAWHLGSCPAYDAVLSVRTPQGTYQVAAQVEHGLIRRACVSCDTLETRDTQKIAELFMGLPFEAGPVKQMLLSLENQKEE